MQTAAAPLVRAEWRIVLDKENLRRLDSEVEAVLDKQVQNIHPKDNIPTIEKLLRTEDYCSMVEFRNAFAKSEKIKLGMMEKTFLNIKEAIDTASGPPPVQPSASTKKRKDLVEEVRNVVKEEMTNMKEEIKAELERAVKRPYSPLPSGARIREPESLRCVLEAVYWDNLLPKVQARDLSFPAHLPTPAVPQLQLCTSEKRPKEDKFKIHSDHCHDECKPCTWSSEAVVQAYWRLQLLPLLQPQMKEAHLVDRHKQKAIPRTSSTNELAPDIVLYCDKMEDIDFYVQSVGEIKFGDSITSEHCGQLAKYAQALFELHPHRSILYGWLATQSKMRLFRFEAQPDRQIGLIETSQDLAYHDGLQQLCTMLRLGALELGLFAEPIPMPDVPGVGLVPQRHLGRGSFATAYAATSPQKEDTVVIKLFRSDEAGAAALRCEEATLKKLREHNVKGVTTLVGAVCYPPTQPQPTVLVVQPEGVTVERVLCGGNSSYHLAHDNICKLLHILRDVHKADVVHCDLSLSNMYFLSEREMFINDFGSAVKAGALARKGNPYFMPLQVLESASEEYVATPAHDLETFVKVLFYGTNQRAAAALERTPPEKKELSQFWRKREAEDRNLHQQLQFARALKYAELAEELKVYG